MSEIIHTPEAASPEAVDSILFTLERRTRVLTAAALHHPDLPPEWLAENLALAHVLAKTALLELVERDGQAGLNSLTSDNQ
jgi:hypothetical protein